MSSPRIFCSKRQKSGGSPAIQLPSAWQHSRKVLLRVGNCSCLAAHHQIHPLHHVLEAPESNLQSLRLLPCLRQTHGCRPWPSQVLKIDDNLQSTWDRGTLPGGSSGVPHSGWWFPVVFTYPGNVKFDHSLSVSNLHVTEPRKFELKVLEGRQALDIKGPHGQIRQRDSAIKGPVE